MRPPIATNTDTGAYDPSFEHMTMAELLIRNFLRTLPFPIKRLTEFSSHKYISLRVHLNLLRTRGHIVGRTVIENDFTRPFLTKGPLPDLPEGPITNMMGTTKKAFDTIKDRRKEQIRQTVSATVGKHLQPVLTERRLLEILDNYIRQGAGGKDLLLAIKTRIELGSLTAGVGPPPPLTEDETVMRLLTIMASAPESAVLKAIDRFHAKDFSSLNLILSPESEIEELPDGPIPPQDDPSAGEIVASAPENAEAGDADPTDLE